MKVTEDGYDRCVHWSQKCRYTTQELVERDCRLSVRLKADMKTTSPALSGVHSNYWSVEFLNLIFLLASPLDLWLYSVLPYLETTFLNCIIILIYYFSHPTTKEPSFRLFRLIFTPKRELHTAGWLARLTIFVSDILIWTFLHLSYLKDHRLGGFNHINVMKVLCKTKSTTKVLRSSH